MTTNERLLNNPMLQRMPRDQREWVQYTNELAKFVLRVARLGDGSMQTSVGGTISGLGEMPGTVPTERSTVMSMVGNNASFQTASPLTSVDAGSSATINVASHLLVTPSGNIAYNSGAITGLLYGTNYYVYAEDPTYAGGAVTYLASTTPATVIGGVGRYYVSSITTSVRDLSASISGIAKGVTTTITTSLAHGLTTGNTVTIDNIVDDGPNGDLETALNGNDFVVTVTGATTFTIPEDTSALTNVYVSGGTANFTAPTTSGNQGGSWGDNLDIPF